MTTGICAYHQCKKETEIYKCEHCGEFFCKDHLNAKCPCPPPFKTPKNYEEKIYMKEWRKDGHPCPRYVEHFEEKIEKEREEYSKALDKLKDKPPRYEPYKYPDKRETYWQPDRKPTSIHELPMSKPKPKLTIPRIPVSMLVLVVALILFVTYYYSNESDSIVSVPSINSTSTTIYKNPTFPILLVNTTSTTSTNVTNSCDDYCKFFSPNNLGTCLDTPNDCKLKNMVYDAGGNSFCPKRDKGLDTFCCCAVATNKEQTTSELSKHLTVENKQDSIEAFEYINDLRKGYGRNNLNWDENLYLLAVSRAKDMYDRNYYDHITPEGKCVKDFKSLFDVNYWNVAENIGGMMYYLHTREPIEGTSPKDVVDGWMNSRGHRYNLLYPFHKAGAIGCYKYICTFLGGNENKYGLGAGPCTTGAKGLTFWKTAPKQDFEI